MRHSESKMFLNVIFSLIFPVRYYSPPSQQLSPPTYIYKIYLLYIVYFAQRSIEVNKMNYDKVCECKFCPFMWYYDP